MAREDDSAAIAAIYNQGIAEGIATFETEPRSAADIARQLREKDARFPTLVVERGGRVVAFAGAGPYRIRPCYAGIAEHSVYVEAGERRTGAGGAALEALIQTYEQLGFWKLVSRIFPENHASLALHDRLGFRQVGIYRRHARLAGIWRDCIIVERLLDPGAQD